RHWTFSVRRSTFSLRINDWKDKRVSQPGEGRAAKSFLAVGPEGERVPPLQGADRFDARRAHRHAIAWRLRGAVRFRAGQLRPLLYPAALILWHRLSQAKINGSLFTCSPARRTRSKRTSRSGSRPRRWATSFTRCSSPPS